MWRRQFMMLVGGVAGMKQRKLTTLMNLESWSLPRRRSKVRSSYQSAILSNALRSAIFRCRRSRLLMMPRVVKLRNALLTASSDIPSGSPTSRPVSLGDISRPCVRLSRPEGFPIAGGTSPF